MDDGDSLRVPGDFDIQFSAMLRPIKDLDKNWAVDIANYLQQYLENFVQHCGSDSELKLLNFAQAALLIQGSAHVYSKKAAVLAVIIKSNFLVKNSVAHLLVPVQFVYNLACELYEQLVNQKVVRRIGVITGFRTLVVIVIGSNNNNKSKDPPSKRRKSKHQSESSDNADKDSGELTGGSDQFLSLDDLPISNSSNKSPHRNASGSFSFRTPIPNDLILQDDLEKGNLMLLNMKGSQLGNRNDTSLYRFLIGPGGSLLSSGAEDSLFSNRGVSDAVPLLQEPPDTEADHLGSSHEPDLDASVFHDNPVSPLPSTPLAPPQSTEKRTRQSRVPRLSTLERPIYVDRFQNSLDPHQNTKNTEKVMKEMKVHRLANSLRKRVNLKRKGSEEKENEENGQVLTDIVPLDVSQIYHLCFSSVSKFSRNPRKVPTSEIFHSTFFKQHKKKLKLLSEVNKERKNADMEEMDVEDQDNDAPLSNDGFDLDPLSEDDAGPDNDLENIPVTQNQSKTYGDPFDALVADSQNVPVVTTYEELAKEQIAKFHECNAKFQRGSDMTKRVAEWEERIQPFLDEEETRRSYDIHSYGSEILSFFEDNNRKQTLPFATMMQNKLPWEVPRYFLSSLLLANCHNVELSTKGVMEEGIDTLELTLLSRKRHHEGLEEFSLE